MKKILYLFFAWRILLFFPLVLSEFFIKFRKGYEYTSPLSFTNSQNPITHFLLSSWSNFDGIHYLTISANGYTVYNSVFFPLFPLVINFLSSLFGNIQALDPRQFFIALILVSAFFLLSNIFLYKLMKLDYKNSVAILTIFFILVFPTSFFFAAIYSESLFFLLLVLSFYFARKKNWLASSIFALFLTATRFVGIAILPALIYEFWKEEKNLFTKKFIPILFIPSGLILYMWYNLSKWGNPLHFIQVQEAFANSRSVNKIILIPQIVVRYIKILTEIPISQYEWWVALLEISTFVFVSVLLFIAWKKKVRTSYLIFSIFALLIPTFTGTFTGLPRYVLPLFPIFIALSLIQNKIIRIVYCAVGIILLFILFALFSKGYYIS